MTMTAPSVDTFTITEEILVHASQEDTFDSIITGLGEANSRRASRRNKHWMGIDTCSYQALGRSGGEEIMNTSV